MKIKVDKRLQYIIWIAVVVAIFIGVTSFDDKTIKTVEGAWDISEQVEANGYATYLIEEKDFDYTTPSVFNLAKNIKSQTTSPDAAIKETIRYVVNNIRYSSQITVPYCYEEKASSVLSSGIGDCVSMSRLVTALLRAQGIPARTVGGCLTSKRCDILFATIPYAEAQVTPMVEGDYKKRGFLHEWVNAWTPSKGWFYIEATSGQTFDTSCGTYGFFGYDSNNYDRCIIQDESFWDSCKVS